MSRRRYIRLENESNHLYEILKKTFNVVYQKRGLDQMESE